MAKEGARGKHLIARNWKLVRNPDVNVPSSPSTASASVENLNSLDDDIGAKVDGNPGFFVMFSVAHKSNAIFFIRALGVSINALLCPCSKIRAAICRRLGGPHRLQLIDCGGNVRQQI